MLPTPPTVPDAIWRALNPADAPAVATLVQALGLENGISPPEDAAYYAGMLADPDADPARNALGLFGADGALGALAWVSLDPDTRDSRRLDLWVDARPENTTLLDFLLGWVEARASQIAAALPPGKRVWANIPTAWSQPDRIARYEAAGFTARHSERFMALDLTAPLPPVNVPDGITLAPWTPARDDLMRETFNAAFADRPGARVASAATWSRYLTGGGFNPTLSFLALANDTGVGMIRSLSYSTRPAEAEIGHVAVVAAWRRRGIGRALLLRALHAMQAAGMVSATLSVSLDNAPAQATYEALGFATYGGYTSYSKTLRDANHAAP